MTLKLIATMHDRFTLFTLSTHIHTSSQVSDQLMEVNAQAYVTLKLTASWLAMRLDALNILVISGTGGQSSGFGFGVRGTGCGVWSSHFGGQGSAALNGVVSSETGEQGPSEV